MEKVLRSVMVNEFVVVEFEVNEESRKFFGGNESWVEVRKNGKVDDVGVEGCMFGKWVRDGMKMFK